MADPISAPFFSVGWRSSGKIDGFFIVGRRFVAEFNGDFKFLGLSAGMEDGIQLFFLNFFLSDIFPL